MKRMLMFTTIVVLSAVSSGVLLAQSNPLIGTWKVDVAKSKYVNAQGPKSGTLTIQVQGDGVKINSEGVAGDGSSVAFSYVTNLDGKDSVVSGVGTPGGEDATAIKRINANTFAGTGKKSGKVFRTFRFVVSKDGKVLTISGKGTNAQGQPVSATQVLDKQ